MSYGEIECPRSIVSIFFLVIYIASNFSFYLTSILDLSNKLEIKTISVICNTILMETILCPLFITC